MQAKEAMTRNVVCVRRTDSLEAAQEIMDEWCVRHLPVMEGEELVGIVSDRDILASSGEGTVDDVMSESPTTCRPTSSLASIGEIMLEKKIDCMPVIDDQRSLVGLITSSDFIQLVVDRERLASTHTLPFRFKVYRSVRPGMMANLAARAALEL